MNQLKDRRIRISQHVLVDLCCTCHVTHVQAFYSRCPLHRDSAEILQFAAETCLSMSTTNHFISLSHGETVNGNRLSVPAVITVKEWTA